MQRYPISLSADELFETLRVWKSDANNNFLAMFVAHAHVAVGAASITKVNGECSIVMTKVVRKLQILDGSQLPLPPQEISFARTEIVSAYQGATADLNRGGGIIGEHYDESLSIVLSADEGVDSVTLYRASQFKR